MKTTLLPFILLASLTAARSQDVDVVSVPAHDRVSLFAQARPEENRDRNIQRPLEPRPPSAPNPPPPPGDRGEGFGRGGDSRSSYSTTSSSGQSRMMRFDSRGRSARPVVVTSKPLDAKELATVEEDLGIMARLLEKEIEREVGAGGPPNAMGISLTRLDGRGPSVMLLEGYGAVFTFTTGMWLTPPPLRTSEEKKAERPTDSPWERTRRELFGPPGVERERNPGGKMEIAQPGRFSGTIWASGDREAWNSVRDGIHYDAKKVEELKKSILETLKQAGNIRALKADDFVTVVVQGGGAGMEVAIEMRTTTSSSSNGGPPRTETVVNREGGDGWRSGTLTIRAKKSDCEDFAKGKLTVEQFAKKALVNLH